jgi:CRISPR/Cas system-associated endoribonuclease Cas2
MTWVITYDISDDRLRERVADGLGRYGWRVQESVFECTFDPEMLPEVVAVPERELGEAENAGYVSIASVATVWRRRFESGRFARLPTRIRVSCYDAEAIPGRKTSTPEDNAHRRSESEPYALPGPESSSLRPGGRVSR